MTRIRALGRNKQEAGTLPGARPGVSRPKRVRQGVGRAVLGPGLGPEARQARGLWGKKGRVGFKVKESVPFPHYLFDRSVCGDKGRRSVRQDLSGSDLRKEPLLWLGT